MRKREAEYRWKALNWSDQVIASEARSLFGDKPHSIVNRTLITQGATSSLTEKVDVVVRYDTWYVREYLRKADTETGPREIENYPILLSLLPEHILTPCLTNPMTGVLWIPWIPYSRNFDFIIGDDSCIPEQDKIAIWDDFLRTTFGLWHATLKKGQPDYCKEFTQRLEHRAKTALSTINKVKLSDTPVEFRDLLTYPIFVNGYSFPPFVDLIQLAKQAVIEFPSPYTVVAHKDEHPANLVVMTKAIENRHPWFLVDLPNVSTAADWVYAVGKMRHWFMGYHLVNKYKKLPENRLRELKMECKITNRLVMVDYDLSYCMPSICRTLDERTMHHAGFFGQLISDDFWQKRLAAMLFLCFYGGIPNHTRCKHVIPLLLALAAEVMKPVIESAKIWKGGLGQNENLLSSLVN